MIKLSTSEYVDKALKYLNSEEKTANMFLEVRPSNLSAIALYENMGFNEMAIRRGYYPAANGREDAVLMGLALCCLLYTSRCV